MHRAQNVCDFANQQNSKFDIDLVPPNIQDQMEKIENISQYIKEQLRLNVIACYVLFSLSYFSFISRPFIFQDS